MNNHGNVTLATLLVICAIIVLLGIALNAYNQIQLELTHCHLDKIRAKMLAHQGLTNAFDELKTLNFDQITNKPRHNSSWYYYGEDLDNNGLLSRGEDQNNNRTLDVETCPLKDALKPSFTLTDRNGTPMFIRFANGARMGYSGELTKTYVDGNDIYTLKITDCHSQIYVNGDDDGTKQLLNNLGVILRISSDIPDEALGNYIFKKRNMKPSGRFTVKEELAGILPKPVYEKIRPYVTLYGQADNKVIKPPRRQMKEGTEIFSWKQITPDDLVCEERHPININTAAKPVLMAALANLEGIYLHQGLNDDEIASADDIKNVFSNTLEKPHGKVEPPGVSIGKLKAVNLRIPENTRLIENIAERIIEERTISPFLEWQAFNKFCDILIHEEFFGDISTPEGYELAQAKADLIKANVNPNTLLNKFNPDRIINRWLDKSDLVTYTTEFCFTPRGYFEVESEGMVLRPSISGEMFLEAGYLTRGVAKIYEIYNETNQSDFSKGRISKQPKEAGETLQTYPQPDINNLPNGCYEDGQIALANVENRAPDNKPIFALHFNKTLKASPSNGKSQPMEMEGNSLTTESLFNGGALYPDGVYSDSGGCPAYESEDNFVDGIANERVSGKKQFRGAVSFWLKPNYYQTSVKPRTIFSLNKATNNPPHPKYNYQPTQHIFSILAFPRAYPYKSDTDTLSYSLRTTPAGKFLWFWDFDESLGNQPQSYIFANSDPANDSHHRWIHIGIAWDTHPKTTRIAKHCPACIPKTGEANNSQEPAWLLKGYCRHCAGTGETSEVKVYPSDVYTFCINGDDAPSKYIGRQPELFPPEIIQQIDFASANSIRLGESIDSSFWNFSGDFTIDEVTIRLPDSVKSAEEQFKDEFANGRYYKNQGIFTSGPIIIKTGRGHAVTKTGPDYKTRIIPFWTAYYPSDWDEDSRNILIQLLNNSDEPISAIYDRQGPAIELSKGKNQDLTFKYKVVFDTQVNGHNKPLLESPFLDDITMIIFTNEPEIMEQFVIEN
ncbi:MAG: hypothetical protein HZA49_07345 [Planctomycetes bacterium]|nr:hypothetical protein [Planctomycetota bacterium]